MKCPGLAFQGLQREAGYTVPERQLGLPAAGSRSRRAIPADVAGSTAVVADALGAFAADRPSAPLGVSLIGNGGAS